MNRVNLRIRRFRNQAGRQQGVVTTFTGILILVLLGLMMFFAIRVGVFEQRVSANDSRQKLAFHVAESGIHHAKEFFLANDVLIASDIEDLLSGGTDGWLAETSEKRWQLCSDADLSSSTGSHPCYGESLDGDTIGGVTLPDMRANSYFYFFEDSVELPLDTDAIIPNATETVNVYALLCVMDLDEDAAIPVQGCSTDRTVADGSYFMLTILARGQADCSGGTCNAEALVSEQISNFGATAGGNSPKVPLTTKSSFPPSGTAEVVPNPNAGGIGVPLSVWANDNTSCSSGTVFDPSSGSWATCEMHEWYGVDDKPDDIACNNNPCSCSFAESMSYTQASLTKEGIDMVFDENFPCDLFQFYFGVPRSSYEIVKGYSKIISDCESLGEDSSGIYWVTGPECWIKSNTIVGSKDHPVVLISAATLTKLNGGSIVYGVLFKTDVEDPNAILETLGTNTVYGSVIVDGVISAFQGTFQVVWADNITEKAGNGGGLGSVLGGWSDFHREWEWVDES
jgi:hypothetical protein